MVWKSERDPNKMISSGLDSFDKQFGGFLLGEMIIFGGRPAMGKSNLLVWIATKMAKNNPVLFFTYDSSKESLTNSFVAAITGVNLDKLYHRELDTLEFAQVVKSLNSELPIYISEECHDSISAFRQYCENMVQKHGIKVVFVDHIQKMHSNRYGRNRESEMSYIVQELKRMAIELNIVLILSSQLSRNVENRAGSKKPMLSDLRESGAIEQYANKVIFLYRAGYYGIEVDEYNESVKDILELLVHKNTYGSLGSIRIKTGGPGFIAYEYHPSHELRERFEIKEEGFEQSKGFVLPSSRMNKKMDDEDFTPF
ncbi:MAG: DnaB-like helicase C-terminal domain-containing protein [Bacteroidetes bacterium]|nr:DnaB-like helicase C-terminal domain-containing protein [Bacteroidota bacterium]